jgi:hypothetical protein
MDLNWILNKKSFLCVYNLLRYIENERLAKTNRLSDVLSLLLRRSYGSTQETSQSSPQKGSSKEGRQGQEVKA